MDKALIAMSGGVDSSVAACLIKEQGYSCIGVTMKLFQNEYIGESREHTCCSLEDVEDARSVARQLNIPYYVFNFSDRFRECVIDKFVRAYEAGITPNPCIDCNRYLKFDKLFHRSKELNCNYVVTGHYARVEYDETLNRYLLKKALDTDKDQSYVLYAMTQEQLSHTLFPLGELTKPEVRKIAEKHSFINAKKHDSQDICFVTGGKYTDFIQQYTSKRYPEGNFVDINGRVLGTHKGIIHYTIGQRRGLNISSTEALYVSAIDSVNNTVTLASENELYTKKLVAKDINMISTPFLEKPEKLKVKVRYRQPEQPATVEQTDTDTLEITFDTPQRAVTSGQAVVIYNGDIVVGGGTIQRK
ncbi:MAG: tRNA 2-thiouridine(34) synthase MnmA [Clostridia bacterium]|nr:tRNA 2-thiouridine(34) synthase MnmA [Clostridia bacterium]